MDELLREYRETRSLLMGYKLNCPEDEKSIVGSMLSDLQYCIDWLNKGHQPQPRRGIYRRSREQRTMVVDPLLLQSYAQPAACGSHTKVGEYERFQIDEALSCLSEREKQAYVLHHGMCFSVGQVALEMQISRGAVGTMLKRAHKKIANSKSGNLFLAI